MSSLSKKLTDPAALAIWRHHFRLAEAPFALTPDPAFFFLSSTHAEALARLKTGLLERPGLTVMIGEVGTGKTVLVHALLNALDSRFRTAYVRNLARSLDEILQSALRAFGAFFPSPGRQDLLDSLQRFVRRCAKAGRSVVLVIDEAQSLGDTTLEELGGLLSCGVHDEEPLQILLVGQPELLTRLHDDPRLREIEDRITVRCDLNPLSPHEARCYVRQRLGAVGGSPELFTQAALNLIVKRSRGVPRRINVLSHNAMLAAYRAGRTTVGRSQVTTAVRETEVGAHPRVLSWRSRIIPASG